MDIIIFTLDAPVDSCIYVVIAAFMYTAILVVAGAGAFVQHAEGHPGSIRGGIPVALTEGALMDALVDSCIYVR